MSFQQTQTFTLTVLDINDETPSFDPAPPSSITVPENATFGTVITPLSADDKDQGAKLSFNIVNDKGIFAIQKAGGGGKRRTRTEKSVNLICKFPILFCKFIHLPFCPLLIDSYVYLFVHLFNQSIIYFYC